MTGLREVTAFRAGVTRVLGLLMIVVSVALAAGCVLAFTNWLPANVARYEEYRAAERCPADSTPDAWWEDCLREIDLTIVDTVVRGGKGSEYRATVDSKRFHGRLDFGDPGPLLDTLQEGDKAVGTVWRGDIVALTKGRIRQKTSDEPRDEPQMIAAAGAGLGLLAVPGLVFGTPRRAAPPRPLHLEQVRQEAVLHQPGSHLRRGATRSVARRSLAARDAGDRGGRAGCGLLSPGHPEIRRGRRAMISVG